MSADDLTHVGKLEKQREEKAPEETGEEKKGGKGKLFLAAAAAIGAILLWKKFGKGKMPPGPNEGTPAI